MRDFKVEKAPIPIEDIAHNLDIRIGYAPSMNYSGILIRKNDGKALLGINSTESPARMRFTIAHELGHFFLDDKKVTIDHRNNYCSIEKKSDKERQADVFAANILMPESFVKKDFLEITKGKVFLEEHLSLLFHTYKVGREAMKNRLSFLGLI